MDLQALFGDKTNFVFIGEAGSGKSEIAINFASELVKSGRENVHFFDLDMTKPLFRSRDVKERLESEGIIVHYEEQFMDAPTVAGGVIRLLKDPDSCVVMDVGGDYIGARSIGGYAPYLNAPGTQVYYVINNYRPWSADLDHIDAVLGQTLGVSHVNLERMQLIANPNLGTATSVHDVLEGCRTLDAQISPFKPISFLCAQEQLAAEVSAAAGRPVLPLRLYLTYPWEQATCAE